MAYIEGHARHQVLLLSAWIEDYVAVDNLVRFIDAFVDDLDLGGAGFVRSRPKATGRPDYDPANMLKLYLDGNLNRVAERVTKRPDLPVIRRSIVEHPFGTIKQPMN